MPIKLEYRINGDRAFRLEVKQIVKRTLEKIRSSSSHRLIVTDDPEYGEREAVMNLEDHTSHILLISEEPIMLSGHSTLTTLDKLHDTLITLRDHQIL